MERLIAAQNAQIGVAEANFYPAFFINGTLGYQSQNLDQQTSFSLGEFHGPSRPGVPVEHPQLRSPAEQCAPARLQNAGTGRHRTSRRFCPAAQEVENGIIAYLNAMREAEFLHGSVKDAQRALQLASEDFQAGAIDYTPVFVAEQFLAQQENLYAQAEGDVDQGLIAVYRALGGGWDYRLHEQAAFAETPPAAAPPGEPLLPPPQRIAGEVWRAVGRPPGAAEKIP